MKNYIELTRNFWGGAALLLALFLYSNTVKAQAPCPVDADGIHPLTTEAGYAAWTPATLIIPDVSPTCSLLVKYCYRTVIDYPCIAPANCTTYQRWVYEVQDIGDCSALTATGKINLATQRVWELDAPSEIPPCSWEQYPTMKLIRPACWELVQTVPKKVYRGCGTTKCFMFCKICDDGESRGHFSCVFQLSEQPTCNMTPDVGCFFVQCPDHP